MRLPLFPEMKQIDMSDRAAVERLIGRFPPYSDFNFINLYSWNIDSKVLLSDLLGNLAVRFADYRTGVPFYMFFGDRYLDDSTETLLQRSKTESLGFILKLIPECVASSLDVDRFEIVQEAEHADYIERVEHLLTYPGGAFASQRHHANHFKRNHPGARFELIDAGQPVVQRQMLTLFEEWAEESSPNRTPDQCHEFAALQRCICNFGPDLIATGVYANQRLIAFTLHELLANGFAVNHFEKAATTKFRGVLAFLTQETATLLWHRGVRLVNIEQDLGIEGLRINKRAFSPSGRFKKFTVRSRNSQRTALMSGPF